MSKFKSLVLSAVGVAAFVPTVALACACGCGVFDVGTATMMPSSPGGTVWFEYDFLGQGTNWAESSQAPKANNPDKQLRSDFFQVGGQYMFNRDWGVMGTVPYTYRHFKTTDDDTGAIVKSKLGDLGDVHLQGVYSGFADDMSTGVTFGLKLPTGNFTFHGFDRDTSIGTGSTDLLLGGYHMGDLTGDNLFNWFVNGQWDDALLTQLNYRPGDETDAAVGGYYNGLDFGNKGKLAPLLQLIGSFRLRDSGMNSNADNSGYTRLLISPGLEYDINDIKVYGDVEFPIYQNVNGNQLVAPVLFKFILGYSF